MANLSLQNLEKNLNRNFLQISHAAKACRTHIFNVFAQNS